MSITFKNSVSVYTENRLLQLPNQPEKNNVYIGELPTEPALSAGRSHLYVNVTMAMDHDPSMDKTGLKGPGISI